MRHVVASAALVLAALLPSTAPGQPIAGPDRALLRRAVGEEFVDRLDILWFEQGRFVFAYGNGRLFGIDVRAAMGNPAALRSTTGIKWENFLAHFNSRLVLLASQFPGQLYPDGVRVQERIVFRGLTEPFNDMALEEQIDLAGYLMRTSALAGANEDETMRAFAFAGYFGGGLGAAYMLSQNSVTLPVTFKLHKGQIGTRPYDVRWRVRVDELGFGTTRHPDLSTRLSLRLQNFSEGRIDFGWKDAFHGSRPARLFVRGTQDWRRYGTYYVAADQTWNPVRQRNDYGWLVGAQADVISPGREGDSRVRTGFEYSMKNATKLPERYLLDLYHRQSLFRGLRDFVIQGRGALLVDGIRFRGVGGELRASYLIGSNVPRYSTAYSRADWDRFARIYVLVEGDTVDRRKRAWSARVVYAAPFDIDRAVESIVGRVDRWLHPVPDGDENDPETGPT